MKVKMTIREEYEMMKNELRRWNKRSNWDETKYSYHIEHHTKKAKKMFLNLLNKDFEKMNWDIKHGFITVEKFNQLWKVWNECSTSIANMNII